MSSLAALSRISRNFSRGEANVGKVKLDIRLPLYAAKKEFIKLEVPLSISKEITSFLKDFFGGILLGLCLLFIP